MKRKFHLTWYLKIPLTDDLSVRYFFVFEDRPDLKGKWVIKSHLRKEYGVIDEKTAQMIVESHGKTLDDAVEIVGRNMINNYYRKVEIKNPKPATAENSNGEGNLNVFLINRFLCVK